MKRAFANLRAKQLDADLDAIAGGRNTTEIDNNLIARAERQGRVADLIAGALRQNSTIPRLQELAEAARSCYIEAPAPNDVPPYKGLAYFDIADHHCFWGAKG